MNPASAASIAADSPPVRIGRFCVTRELGRGTLGCVYLAHDPVIGRDVAIKTFSPRLSLLDRQKHEEHFVNEARAAGRLAHPHIVTVHDVFSEGGASFIVLEYLAGRELDKLLAEGRRFEPDEAASIIWRIADALDHAHQRGVVHRDIKPANIFMQDEQPKLIDFGIARAPNRLVQSTGNGDNPPTVFSGEGLLGTPNYMSPEQAQGKPVDARTDIYSLGAVMYEMLTGRKPFSAESAEKLVQQIVSKAPPAPHEIDARIPRTLSHIVMKAMSKSPEKRYPSAEKMALDIRRHLLRERRRRRRLSRTIAAPLEPGITARRAEGGGPLWAVVGAALAAALAYGAWALLR